MLTGLPPFYTPNRDELFQRIKYGTLILPENLSPAAKSLLNGLFTKDPERRLGGGPNGAEDIKKHPWFEGIDWNAVLRREFKPPFVPKTKGDLDVSNFDVVIIILVNYESNNHILGVHKDLNRFFKRNKFYGRGVESGFLSRYTYKPRFFTMVLINRLEF